MKRFFKYLFFIVIGIVLVGVAANIFLENEDNIIRTFAVHRGDLVRQVSVSGKVVAAESVDLVFSQSGRVSFVYTRVDAKVFEGDILATIENDDLHADILQKEAAYESAQAKLESLQAGTRPEQLAVTQSSIESATVAIARANESIIDAIESAYTQSDDAIHHRIDQFITNPKGNSPRLDLLVADGQLKSDIEWGRLQMESALSLWNIQLAGLGTLKDPSDAAKTAMDNLDFVRAFLEKVALAVNSLTPDSGTSQAVIDGYRLDVTTARANINSAIIMLTAVITAQKNAATALVTAQKKLMLEEAGTADEDVAAQKAQVKAAHADLERSRANYKKTLITAPFNGIVTKMDARVGGSASPGVPLISMISADTLEIESFVPETSAPLLNVGDNTRVTFDAYGSDIPFDATIISIDPAETIRDGISTYRTKLRLSTLDDRVKSGMTANIIVVTEKKMDVISIPQGIIFEHDGKKFVRIKTGDTIKDVFVVTGSLSSLGTIEIIFGLKEGDEVVIDSGVK